GGRTLVRTPEVAKLAAALGSNAVVSPAADGDVYVTGVDAAAIGDAARRADVAIHQLTTQRPDLEAVFLELPAGQAAIRGPCSTAPHWTRRTIPARPGCGWSEPRS